MAFDKTLELSTEQSVLTGTVFSTKYHYLQALPGFDLSGSDVGEGNPLFCWFHITESFAGGDGSFVTFEAITDSILIGGEPDHLTSVVMASTGAVPAIHPIIGLQGPLLAGETHHAAFTRLDIPSKTPSAPSVYPVAYRSIQFRYTVVGTFTTGKVTARITDVHPAIGMKKYPAGKFGTISLPLGT
jgi:hypothetical protein